VWAYGNRRKGLIPLRGISAECPSGSRSRSPLLDACVLLLQSEEGGAVTL
jgi:hypothetical protein